MWFEVCEIEDLVSDTPYYVEVKNLKLCVLRIASLDNITDSEKECRLGNGDFILVYDDICPHAGASLSNGRIYDSCLVCPLHAWAFRLRDGLCPDNESIGIKKYLVMIQGNRIMVEIFAD